MRCAALLRQSLLSWRRIVVRQGMQSHSATSYRRPISHAICRPANPLVPQHPFVLHPAALGVVNVHGPQQKQHWWRVSRSLTLPTMAAAGVGAAGSSAEAGEASSGVSGSGAWLEPRFVVEGSPGGPLAGLSFGAKDLFDVKGHPTGFGNPTWLQTHPAAAEAHAPAVQVLLDAGATLTGKTHMDEIAYSLNGENTHYGTPLNPAASPGRIPGGSSSGSASAVACGEADFSLGSDTAGSVRVPAAYCGLFGFRSTWGRISLEGARPLSLSYDTGGCFARSAELLQRIGGVLLTTTDGGAAASGGSGMELKRWLVATDAFDLADKEAGQAIYNALSADFEGVKAALGSAPTEVSVSDAIGKDLFHCMDVFRVTQGREIWEAHGEWVTTASPSFGPGVRERFEMCSRITDAEVQEALAARERIREAVWRLLGDDGILALPTAPGPAPLINTPAAELDAFRKRLISVCSIASLCQLPQVNIPVASVEGGPVGLGLIGPRGSDEQLLAITARLAGVLGIADS